MLHYAQCLKKTAEPRLQIHFGPTKSLLRTEKMCLVAANVSHSLIFCWALAVPRKHWIPLAESTGRTLMFHRTPVENTVLQYTVYLYVLFFIFVSRDVW